jgi:adenylate kinase
MKKILLLLALVLIVILGITSYKKSKQEKPLVIIMMGAPGAGKGTHCVELSKTLSLPHISTGDLFRENIRNQTELGKTAKDLIDKGQLVPDNIVVEMLFNHINSKGYDKTGYILDGFPRTLNQAISLEQKLNNKYKKIAINLNISEEKLIARITNRFMCKDCGTIYNKISLPSKIEGKCDKCSGELYQRKDDNEEVFKNRLQIYNKDTKPLLDFYENKKELYNIDSNFDKEIVFENIMKTIKEVK